MASKEVHRFFRYARDRHQIYLNRVAGMPRTRWTSDPIFQTYRFTNVFRELDKTTQWFAQHVRSLEDPDRVLLATVLFRMLNRIEVGEAVFRQIGLRGLTAFDEIWGAACSGRISEIKAAMRTTERAIYSFCGTKGPFVTGAYIITSKPGMAKLPGVLSVVQDFMTGSSTMGDKSGKAASWTFHDLTEMLMVNPGKVTLEQVWEWLSGFPFFGKFHSYEIVTDLRHTELLNRAPDIMTWANPGPGAQRGANRVFGRLVSEKTPRVELIGEMQHLLAHSRSKKLWPNNAKWPKWEMRDVEHTLCEFDKYERVRLEEGKPRGVYR